MNSALIYDVLSTFNIEVSALLKLIANQNRLIILNELIGGRKTFKELQDKINLSKTALSYHLDLLLESHLINQMSRGNYGIANDGENLLDKIVEIFLNTQKAKEDKLKKKSDYIIRLHSKVVRKMNELKVKIIELEPMYVASTRVISKTPENDAWEKIKIWAEENHLLENLDEHPVYGFNNPNPSKDKPEYGYEFWIKVDPFKEYTSSNDIEIKKIPGGKYAVAVSNLKEDIDVDGVLKTWKRLTEWVKENNYECEDTQCLEKAVNPGANEDELTLELYFPIKKK